MGNRAVIAYKESPIALYLHWNGGMDSVKPLLDYCKIAGFPKPDEYGNGFTQLAATAMNFIGDSGSIILSKDVSSDELNPGDNGIYWVDGNWDIVERETYDGFIEQDAHDYWTMLIEWREVQGRATTIPFEMLASDPATVEDVSTGDSVYVRAPRNEWEKVVVGEKYRMYGRAYAYVHNVVDGETQEGSKRKVFESESIRVVNQDKVAALNEALSKREK